MKDKVRFLLYHDPSESLFEEFTQQDRDSAIGAGECLDVSGILQFEMLYQQQ